MMRIQIAKAFSMISVILLMACSGGGDKKEAGTDSINKSFLPYIKTEKAVRINQEGELTLTGNVEYNPDKIINYTPLINGIVDRVYFSIGDKVAAGQKLFDLRSTELSQLQAEETSLKSEEKIAEREMKSARSLYDDNMLSEKELLEAQAKLEQAQASVKRIETNMSFYNYNSQTGTFSVISPMNGYIVDRNVSSGSTISSEGEAIFTVADLSTVWITVNVYAKDLLSVCEGMDAEIQLLSYPNKVFNGKIDKLSNVFDPDEKILKARILMNNKDLLFKPGMSAVIKLKNKSERKMIAISSDALVFDNNQYYVVVEKADDHFEIKEVTLSTCGNGMAYIESGLSEGENVVIKNQLLVYSQLK